MGPDGGVSFLTSDFVYQDDDDAGTARYRPEHNERPFGTSFPANPVNSDGTPVSVVDDDDDIPTESIVIGRAISNSMTCFHLWSGFYNEYDGERCIHKTELAAVALANCANSFVPPGVNGYEVGDVISEFVVNVVQGAIDQLALPNFYLAPANVIVNLYQGNPCNDPCDDNLDDECDAVNVNRDFYVTVTMTLIVMMMMNVVILEQLLEILLQPK